MKDDLEALLGQETDDPVPAAHERRIREGLGALLAGAPAPVAKAPSSPASTTAAGAAPATITLTRAALVGLGLAAGGFAVGRATAPTPPPAPSVSATVAPAPSAPPMPSSTVPSSPSASASAAPSVSATPSAVATAPPSPTSAFDREQSLLERARAALVRHDAAAAAEALDACEKQFPASRHAEDRDYLRIQVLRERGDTAAVRTRAQAFLATYPNSLLRARVEPLAR